MDIIIWIITTTIILILISTILNSVYKNSKIKNLNINEEIVIIKPNKMFLYVGIAGIIAFPIIALLTFLFPAPNTLDTALQEILFISFMFLFLLLYFSLTFFYLNYKIILFKDHFIYQNFFRHKKILNYNEIKLDNSKLYTTIQIKKKNGKYRNLFKINPSLDNSQYFMDYYKSSKIKTTKSKEN